MLISFTNRTPNALRTGLIASMTLLLVACATGPSHDFNPDGEHAISKYAAQREGEAAGASTADHIPVVPHTKEASAQAQEASGDYVMALQAMNEKDWQKALVILQSISSRYPLLSGPLVNQGLIYIEQEKYKEAKEVLEKALEVNDQNPYAWNALGLTERSMGQFAASLENYNKALELDPLYARAHFNLAVLADLYLNDLNLALTHYKNYQSLQREPDKSVAIWIKDLENRTKRSAMERRTNKNNNDNAQGGA